jgi:hypothetical protein
LINEIFLVNVLIEGVTSAESDRLQASVHTTLYLLPAGSGARSKTVPEEEEVDVLETNMPPGAYTLMPTGVVPELMLTTIFVLPTTQDGFAVRENANGASNSVKQRVISVS